ncbi:DUF5906 domain-containing protein [Staphylococcus haemolyticus]
MSKNNTVQKQNTPTLNNKWFTDIHVINDGIFTSYKNYGTLYNNVNKTLSNTEVDDDLYNYLKDVVFELDTDNTFKDATMEMYLHKDNDDADMDVDDPTDKNIIKTLGRYHAYLKLMCVVVDQYNPRCCFLKATFKPKFDKGNLIHLIRKNVQIDPELLANFILEHHVKGYMQISSIEGAEDLIYYYDRNTHKVTQFKKAVVKRKVQHLVHQIYSGFRSENSKAEKQVVDTVMNLIPNADDLDANLIDKYTEEHPQHVWFKNGIYDIEQDQLIEHKHTQYLRQHHDYNLPVANDDEEPLTLQYLETKCPKTLNRLNLLVGNASEYMTTLLGYSFMHTHKLWNIVTFLYDPNGSSGKSFFIGNVIEKMFGSANIQSVGLNQLSANRFASSDMVGKEMNLVTEVDDSHFNAELINNLKKISGGDTVRVEAKFKQGKPAALYSKMLFSMNKGLPQVSTSLQDGGVLRRIVIVPTTGHKPTAKDKEDFTQTVINEELPYFALYCMKKFNQHYQNGVFNDFSPVDVNNPLVTNEMAMQTRKFIDKDNRILQFFIYKAIDYLDNTTNEITSQQDMIDVLVEMLKYYPKSTMKDDFINWFKSVEEYKNDKGLKKYFKDNMDQQFSGFGLNMESRTRVRHPKTGKTIDVLQEKAIPHIVERIVEHLNYEDYTNKQHEDNTKSFNPNIVNFGGGSNA